jgi:hypothetical protein
LEGCKIIEDLKVHSKHNCYLLNPDEMKKIEEQISVRADLEQGTYVIRIRSGSFDYVEGCKFINKKNDVAVGSTWSTLNGYDDTLTLDVLEPAKLSAFFFDTHLDDNEGEVIISVVKI